MSFVPSGADVVTLDMGGTSCDLAIVSGGVPRQAGGYEPEFGLPLVFPSIEVSTIGAGGGSIVWLDDGGFLRVGPRSAAAEPGPAAYGKGGSEPTLTDANLLLGRLDPDYFLGGELPLDQSAARAAFEPLAAQLACSVQDAALASVRIANENMAAAVRERTVEVGIDVRHFTLVALGGAGPLHACALARTVGMSSVLVPPHPGLGSAFGAAVAELRSDRIATGYFRSDTARGGDVAAVVAPLAGAARAELRAEGFAGEPEVTTGLALRYVGQNYEHTVRIEGDEITDAVLAAAFGQFEQLHDRFYGYDLRGQAIELVELTVTARDPSQRPPPPMEPPNDEPRRQRAVTFVDGASEAVVVRRAALAPGDTLAGPALVEEPDSTLLLEHGDRLQVLPDGPLSINLRGRKP
jgi:N-methylhydantoinase A